MKLMAFVVALTFGLMSTLHAADKEAPVGGDLGDLTSYKLLAEETLKLVKANGFAAAKTKITELESAWDKAEEKMKPMSPAKWTSVDKSIDRALAQIRSGKPDAAACTTALETLIAKLEVMNKKK